MPGIGEEMDGAVQHAPQPGRQSMPELFRVARRMQAARASLVMLRTRGADLPPHLAESPMLHLQDYTQEPIGRHRYYRGATPYYTMKLTVPTLVTLLALGGGVATLSIGCAGTATRESTGEYIDDASLTTKVKAAFVKDPLVKALDVKVDTFKGVVQLSGFVDTSEQKSRAEQVAASTTGVRGVKNNITVKSAAR
jgi:hypothetical protein